VNWNERVISEIRANDGRLGGNFAGAPMALVHVFASKAGAPAHPDWYRNLVAAGHGIVEVGTEHYAVEVTELHGNERDLVAPRLSYRGSPGRCTPGARRRGGN